MGFSKLEKSMHSRTGAAERPNRGRKEGGRRSFAAARCKLPVLALRDCQTHCALRVTDAQPYVAPAMKHGPGKSE